MVGPIGEHLKVRVAAPPVDDAANEELIAFLARALGVARARITIRSGERGRRKVVEAIGVSPEETEAALTHRSGRR